MAVLSSPDRVGPGVTRRGRTRPCTDNQWGHPIDRCAVLTRMGNYSAFNGYRWTPSDYSQVACTDCGATWRTKAAYVDTLPDRPRFGLPGG